jgi:hypothetical protein
MGNSPKRSEREEKIPQKKIPCPYSPDGFHHQTSGFGTETMIIHAITVPRIFDDSTG